MLLGVPERGFIPNLSKYFSKLLSHGHEAAIDRGYQERS